MSQTIEIVAGDDVVAASLQDIFSAIVSPGILSGFDLSVSSSQTGVTVAPGTGIFDSGAFIFETEQSASVELPIGGGAQNFTILYLFTPTNTLGGTPATLTYQLGLVDPDTFVGGLVLGWIIHSGGSTLNPSEFIPGRQLKLTIPKEKQKNNFIVSFAPFSTKWALVSGVSLSVTEGWNNTYGAIITQLTNTTGSLQAVTYYYPLLVPSTGLGQLLVECEVPNIANLSVAFIDTSGASYAPTDNSWTFIASSMSQKILKVPQSLALASGGMAFISLTMNLQPGAVVKFKTIGFSSYTEPF